MLKKIFNISMPLKLALMFVFVLFCGSYIPLEAKKLFYTASISIKSVFFPILPFIIFSFLFSCLASLRNGAMILILLAVLGVVLSNFSASMVSYFVGKNFLVFSQLAMASIGNNDIVPLFEFKLPFSIPNQYGLFAGIIVGLLSSYFNNTKFLALAQKFKAIASFILDKIIVPLLPIFIFGYLIKMEHSGMLPIMLKNYGPIFVYILTAEAAYIFLILFVSNDFSTKAAITNIKNMIPCLMVGFSTMSSAAALPFSLKCTEKNIPNEGFVRAIFPLITNIHLVGCSIFIPIMSFAILSTYGAALPTFNEYLVFAFFFVLAKFSVAAVPAGGVIVMIPILERYFGMNSDMLSMLTALYVMFDCFITPVNIAGNSALTSALYKAFTKVNKVRIEAEIDEKTEVLVENKI